jgi:hypothetical protein
VRAQPSIEGTTFIWWLVKCKSFDRFETRDFSRMRDFAKAFPGATLVFSTFRKELTTAEKKAITKIADLGRRPLGGDRWENPVMVLTGLELFSREKMPYCWKAAKSPYDRLADVPFAPDLVEGVCRATQEIHLGMEPYAKWLERWHATRQSKKLKRAAQQPPPTTDAAIPDLSAP